MLLFSTCIARCLMRSIAFNAQRLKNINSGSGKCKCSHAAQRRHVRISLRINLYQRTLVQLQISCTCTNPIDSPIFLTSIDIKICDISDDIQGEIMDENISVSVAAVRSSNQELSYTCQYFLTSVLLKEDIKRDKQELVMLNIILSKPSVGLKLLR